MGSCSVGILWWLRYDFGADTDSGTLERSSASREHLHRDAKFRGIPAPHRLASATSVDGSRSIIWASHLRLSSDSTICPTTQCVDVAVNISVWEGAGAHASGNVSCSASLPMEPRSGAEVAQCNSLTSASHGHGSVAHVDHRRAGTRVVGM